MIARQAMKAKKKPIAWFWLVVIILSAAGVLFLAAEGFIGLWNWLDTFDDKAVNDVATLIALSAGVPALLFTLIYGIGSPFYRSYLGWVVFSLGFSITLVLAVVLLRRWFKDYPGYEWVAIGSYSLLTLTMWSLVAIVIVERRRAPMLTLPLQRSETGSIRIIRKEEQMTNPNQPSQTPNVVVSNPAVRKVMNIVLGVALVVFPAATVLDATSPALDFASWLVPATAVTSFLAGVFGLAVTTPNVPKSQ